MPGTPVPSWLDTAINRAIEHYPSGRFGPIVAASAGHTGVPLCIKYTPAEYTRAYRMAGKQLKVSTNPAFTWGMGTYVTPITCPLSAAIFARVGIVSQFDPSAWRVFDAVDPANEDLYLEWLGRQRAARRAHLTMHTALDNFELRNNFRTHFQIDCVLFRPDQYNRQYTDPRRDVWMNVSDWRPDGTLEDGWSTRFTDPKVCVLIEEEFVDVNGGRGRRGLLNLTGAPAKPVLAAADVAAAYQNNTIVRVHA